MCTYVCVHACSMKTCVYCLFTCMRGYAWIEKCTFIRRDWPVSTRGETLTLLSSFHDTTHVWIICLRELYIYVNDVFTWITHLHCVIYQLMIYVHYMTNGGRASRHSHYCHPSTTLYTCDLYFFMFIWKYTTHSCTGLYRGVLNVCRVIYFYCVKCLLRICIYCVAGASEQGYPQIIGILPRQDTRVLIIYGVASIIRIDKIIDLFCKRAL